MRTILGERPSSTDSRMSAPTTSRSENSWSTAAERSSDAMVYDTLNARSDPSADRVSADDMAPLPCSLGADSLDPVGKHCHSVTCENCAYTSAISKSVRRRRHRKLQAVPTTLHKDALHFFLDVRLGMLDDRSWHVTKPLESMHIDMWPMVDVEGRVMFGTSVECVATVAREFGVSRDVVRRNAAVEMMRQSTALHFANQATSCEFEIAHEQIDYLRTLQTERGMSKSRPRGGANLTRRGRPWQYKGLGVVAALMLLMACIVDALPSWCMLHDVRREGLFLTLLPRLVSEVRDQICVWLDDASLGIAALYHQDRARAVLQSELNAMQVGLQAAVSAYAFNILRSVEPNEAVSIQLEAFRHAAWNQHVLEVVGSSTTGVLPLSMLPAKQPPCERAEDADSSHARSSTLNTCASYATTATTCSQHSLCSH